MLSLGELAVLLGAELRGGGEARPVRGVCSVRQASADCVVFAGDAKSFAAACAGCAAAVLVSPQNAVANGKPLLLTPNPRLAFCRAAVILSSTEKPAEPAAIHPTAQVAPGASLAEGVSLGPYAVVAEEARIGRGSKIGAGAVIGRDVTVGANCRIYPRVVLYPGASLGDRVVVHAGAVLGSDGFGYVMDPATGKYLPFPQQGRLVIEDDVEIGANTAIDRGALEETRIARGSKIDNLVHIGHNVAIGRNVVIAAQTGISGSSAVGDGAVLGGQVGIGDHASVGERVILGGQAGILPGKHLTGPGAAFWGTPAAPLKRYLRQLAALRRLGSRRDET